MLKRVSLLFCACAFMFLAACAGSKSSGGSSYYSDSDDDGGGYSSGGGGGKKGKGGSGEDRPPRADELKDAKNEATSLTEENHKLAKEVFDLKNKLGVSTDD